MRNRLHRQESLDPYASNEKAAFRRPLIFVLRGPESNRRLEVLLHLLFPVGMDYTTIP